MKQSTSVFFFVDSLLFKRFLICVCQGDTMPSQSLKFATLSPSERDEIRKDLSAAVPPLPHLEHSTVRRLLARISRYEAGRRVVSFKELQAIVLRERRRRRELLAKAVATGRPPKDACLLIQTTLDDRASKTGDRASVSRSSVGVFDVTRQLSETERSRAQAWLLHKNAHLIATPGTTDSAQLAANSRLLRG